MKQAESLEASAEEREEEALEVVEKNSLLKTAKENAGTIGGVGFLVIGACIGICVWRYCKAAAGK